MSTVAESPKRLFWLIVLAIFLPWLSIALEFGWGQEFVKIFVLSFIIPIVFALSGIPVVVLAGQVVSFFGFGYALYMLCMRRYQPLPQDSETFIGSDTDLPEYTPSEEPVRTAGKQ